MSKFFKACDCVILNKPYSVPDFLLTCYDLFSTHFVAMCVNRRIIVQQDYIEMISVHLTVAANNEPINIPQNSFVKFQKSKSENIAISANNDNIGFFIEIGHEDILSKLCVVYSNNDNIIKFTIKINTLEVDVLLTISINLTKLEKYCENILDSKLDFHNRRRFHKAMLRFELYIRDINHE